MSDNILLVDDTPTNLQVLVGFLAHGGYVIRIAEDGPSALDQIARQRPDLILLDVAMPGMDGFELCRQLKQDPETKDIPVLFLTARTEISDRLAGFGAGAVDYLAKPIQKEEVIARVSAHLTIVRQRRQLQAMLEQRQRFMRIAAHDLRNLVTIIAGFSELGMMIQDPAEQQPMFSRINQASTQMKALIEDFLALNTLSQTAGGKAETFDLRPVIEQVSDQSSLAAQSKSINLVFRLPPGPILVSGNLGHTHQILSNYTSNALKFSPPGSLTCLSAQRKDHCWHVEVRDQGPGILPEERPKLFLEFPRISNRPTGGETSTGLGLSIVKSLAESQGGNVGADFPAEGGSAFWLEMPAV
jgi:signal transduction histidine kinase